MPDFEPKPNGWGDEKLTEYFDAVRRNQFATYQNKPEAFGLLSSVDATFQRACDNLINPSDFLAALLFIRAHSAYRAACSAAASGQVVECFVILRSSLEYSGYSLLMNRESSLAELWMQRHDSEETEKEFRNAFVISRIREAIRSEDKRLWEIYKDLYDRTLHYGAHPNERALTASMQMEDVSDGTRFLQLYMHGDGPQLDAVLKSSAQVGVTVLHVFRCIFQERFEILGLNEDLARYRNMDI